MLAVGHACWPAPPRVVSMIALDECLQVSMRFGAAADLLTDQHGKQHRPRRRHRRPQLPSLAIRMAPHSGGRVTHPSQTSLA